MGGAGDLRSSWWVLLLAWCQVADRCTGFYLDRFGLPIATNSTSEAVRARSRWLAMPNETLFLHVHIHKCGGMTVDYVIPRVLFGWDQARSDCPKTWPLNYTSDSPAPALKPRCLLRQHGMEAPEGVDWVRSRYDESPPLYVSSIAERGAYELLPWQSDTIKFSFVRVPWDRMMSDAKFFCRFRDAPQALYHVRDVSTKTPRRSVLQGNHLQSHLLPEQDYWDDEKQSDDESSALDEWRKAASTRLWAFGFLGVVEHFEASLCLFARTFATGPGATDTMCELCCADRAVPQKNEAPPSANSTCDFDYDDDDRERYRASHRADYLVYELASDIFFDRLKLAVDDNWGGDLETTCGCALHYLHSKRRGLRDRQAPPGSPAGSPRAARGAPRRRASRPRASADIDRRW